MKFFIFRLVSNTKWCFSSWIRCFLVAFILGLGFSFPLILNSDRWIYGFEEAVLMFATFTIPLIFLLRIMGWGLFEYVPDPAWNIKVGKSTKGVVYLCLLSPLILLLIHIVDSKVFPNTAFWVISEMTMLFSVILFLILRKPIIPDKESREKYERKIQNKLNN